MIQPSYPQFRNFDVSTKLIHRHEVVHIPFDGEEPAVYLFGLATGMNHLNVMPIGRFVLSYFLTCDVVYDNPLLLQLLVDTEYSL